MNRLPSKPRVKQDGFHITLPTLAFTADVPGWLPHSIILFAILAVSSVYLWPSPLEFPMDDSYIHFVYAENLSERGGLFFNSPDEVGVGTSSLLWVLILATGNWAGLSLHWVAKLAGMVALAAVGIGLYHLLRPLLSSWVALASALLVVLSGHMLWFGLSGMETVLFLALGLMALLCYRDERWVWLAILLGLLVITRLEWIILALVIGVFDIWRHRAVRRSLLVAATLSGLICCPWILYLWLRTGYILPTSGMGRHFSNIVSIQIATAQSESLALLSRFPALAYPLLWIGYSIEFILGGYALPAPYLYITPGLGLFSYRLSIWAILGLATVVLPLLWISVKWLVIFLKTRAWEKDKARLPLLIFLFWMVMHNLSYMIYLPTVGAASRYASLNHITLWLALGLGILHVRQSRYRYWLAAGLTTIALANTVYWNKVYDANLEHMHKARIDAADYIREKLPEDALCAASDIGALRFHSQRHLVDLGGLIDPGLSQWYLAGRMDQYLIDHRVTCLALPGRMDISEDGIFDIAGELGFSQSSLLDLRQAEVYKIDRQRWLFGYLPTMNYQATVTIYALVD